uniref:uncharacterized protein LOC122602704 n=1 Tax=Erigeron canadensis TaxID=72917 RepID=UPI001CB905A7|nr:uncharacterized protein LOC122602704 [Erigeron canadensis]
MFILLFDSMASDIGNEDRSETLTCNRINVFNHLILAIDTFLQPRSRLYLIYSSSDEVVDIAKRLLNLLKVGGYMFFGEMCSSQSEDHKLIDLESCNIRFNTLTN